GRIGGRALGAGGVVRVVLYVPPRRREDEGHAPPRVGRGVRGGGVVGEEGVAARPARGVAVVVLSAPALGGSFANIGRIAPARAANATSLPSHETAGRLMSAVAGSRPQPLVSDLSFVTVRLPVASKVAS